MSESGCYFCGPVKNCAPHLDAVFKNIATIGNDVFGGAFKIIIFYDKSSDDSLDILKRYQTHFTTDKFTLLVNHGAARFPYRTFNIARARNACLGVIRKERKFPLFAMMDFDDVNAAGRNPNCALLHKYLSPEYNGQWDALSFNTTPYYYDIWGLSIYPYCFSYNHFRENARFYNIIKDFVTARLHEIQRNDANGLLPCISAFNGFAIYKLDLFNGCLYDGQVNTRLIPANMMKAHKHAAGSDIIYPIYTGVADCRVEDCEHRAFHVRAFLQNGAKIRISPHCLFQ